MKKLLILTIFVGTVLTGCGSTNEAANVGQTQATEPAGNSTTVEQPATGQEEPAEEAPPAVAEEENPADAASPAEQGTASVETKQEYLQKLDEVEESLADLKALNEEGTTVSMNKAAEETYKRWDTALNEIYSELKQQLPDSEMAALKEEQLNWIQQRDETAAKEAAQYEGGTMEGLQYVATQAGVTKERCYELVEEYMK
ncbi:DUF1311 domain-containing protein [Paenibacillus sp. P96]|uniref:DUF1311 domain-containing protein n=1 Tax=Paenibacillus zeirhizosphaerae TaxID=2987519 RepID=A0ABT9FXJ5_9BACL|nr:lysozyme inhibitor LprI family protein [Paenibacillus sp. P96]MDP4099437.1 DUF1311 domain-containing protein [Paenibacillus sp. P96]